MSILSQTRKILGQKEVKAPEKKAPKKAGKKAATKKASDKAEATKPETTTVVMPVQAGRIDLRPLVTEKSVGRRETGNVIAFRVTKQTTKGQIFAAVKERYKVEPLAVRTLTMKPKRRQRGRTIGRTKNWKKAYVSLPANASIDLTA